MKLLKICKNKGNNPEESSAILLAFPENQGYNDRDFNLREIKNMNTQKLLSYTRKAIDEYRLIQDNDKIAVGISGGKDSLTLLVALANLRRFYPHPFSLEAITVDLGNPGFGTDKIRSFCQELGVNYTCIQTDIAKIIFEERKEKNPCSLCAKMRKGALNDAALELGCNKIAYAHHKDDLIETMMMSLIFEGRINTFSPLTHLDRTGLYLIRPLIFVNEEDIRGYAQGSHLPVTKSNCPADGFTKREYTKELLTKIYEENPGARDRMFGAILNHNFDSWPKRIDRYEALRQL